MLLTEGGNAVKSLMVVLKKNNPDSDILEVSIPKNQLALVWEQAITPILEELASAGVIDENYEPQYCLGSSRLAYNIMKGNLNDESAKQAAGNKQSFGDIDVDVKLMAGKSMKDAATVITDLDPRRFAVKISGNELNVAAVITGLVMANGSVIPLSAVQVDFVNVANSPDYYKFIQSADDADIANNVKGCFHKFLLQAIMKNIPAPQVTQSISAKNEISNLKSSGYDITNPCRYSMKSDGLRLVCDLSKDGIKEVKTVNLTTLPMADYSDDGKRRIASILLGPSFGADDIKSASTICKGLSSASCRCASKIQDILNTFAQICDANKSCMSSADYNSGISFVNNSIKPTSGNKIMENIRESIRRNLFEDDSALIEDIVNSIVNDPVVGEANPMSEDQIKLLKQAYTAGFMSSNENFNGRNAKTVYRNSALKPESVVWNKNHQRGFENFMAKLGK